MEHLKGTGVALVTPFNSDLSVDVIALTNLVEFNIANGINYLVVLGTTGEAVTLNAAEKQQVMQTVVQVNAGRLPLVVGVGGNNTAAVVNEVKQLDLSGFDAILSVSPYYSKPTQEGIYQHFKAIANATPKPIIVYNVPSRTGSNILPETIARLATNHKEIIAIKEASGDMVQVMEVIHSTPSDFLVISGDDFTALPTVLAGGAGVISVLGQGLPKEFSKMISLGLQGSQQEAFELHYGMLAAMNLIFEEGNPAGIKSLLSALNYGQATVRLPLVEASKSLTERIAVFLQSFAKVHA